MPFFIFGPTYNSWAIGNSVWSCHKDLVPSYKDIFEDGTVNGGNIEWASVGPNGLCYIPVIENLPGFGGIYGGLGYGSNQRKVYRSQNANLLADTNADTNSGFGYGYMSRFGRSVEHVSFSQDGGWIVCYTDQTVRRSLNGTFPEAFCDAVSGNLELRRNDTSVQSSGIKYVFFGANDSFVVQFHNGSTVWHGIPKPLVEAIRRNGNNGLHLSKNTVLCPWDSSYYFAEWEPVGYSPYGTGMNYLWNIHPNGYLSDILVREVIEGVVPVSCTAHTAVDRPPPSLMAGQAPMTAPSTIPKAEADSYPASPKEPTRVKEQEPHKPGNPFRKKAEDPSNNEFLTKDDLAFFEQIFHDSEPHEGACYITGDSAVILLRQLGQGLDDEALARIWEASDDDDNGVLSLSEFLKAMGLIWKAVAETAKVEQRTSLSHIEGTSSPAGQASSSASMSGKRAVIEWDYKKAEDNEIDLVEGQYVASIDQVDGDWWKGQNEKGETGLFPRNYVRLVGDDAVALALVKQSTPQSKLPAASGQKKSTPPMDLQPTSIRKIDAELICDFCCRNITDYAFSCSICNNGDFDMCKPCKQLGRGCPGHHSLKLFKLELEYGLAEDVRKMNLNTKSNPSSNNPSSCSGRREEDKQLKDTLIAAIVTEKPNVRWEDVAGLEGAKEELQEAVVLPLRFPDLFSGGRKARRGMLLYGPPGTGKSFLAKAIATEVDLTLFTISASDLLSKWIGESERLIKQLFELAREKTPSIIFIDEIDSLCGTRDGNSNQYLIGAKTEMLVQMDGVGKDNDGLLVLAATNIPWSLDPAIRRRFQRRIHIPLPDENARRQLFKISAYKMGINLTKNDYVKLGKLSESLSGSDIANAIQDALMIPIKKIHSSTHYKKIMVDGKEFFTPCKPDDEGAMAMSWRNVPKNQLKEPKCEAEDVYSALSRVKPSVSQEDIDKANEWTEMFGSEGA